MSHTEKIERSPATNDADHTWIDLPAAELRGQLVRLTPAHFWAEHPLAQSRAGGKAVGLYAHRFLTLWLIDRSVPYFRFNGKTHIFTENTRDQFDYLQEVLGVKYCRSNETLEGVVRTYALTGIRSSTGKKPVAPLCAYGLIAYRCRINGHGAPDFDCMELSYTGAAMLHDVGTLLKQCGVIEPEYADTLSDHHIFEARA